MRVFSKKSPAKAIKATKNAKAAIRFARRVNSRWVYLALMEPVKVFVLVLTTALAVAAPFREPGASGPWLFSGLAVLFALRSFAALGLASVRVFRSWERARR